ncbi:unnamed protein product [Allacma fusca]|uniref:Defensin-like protein n=1 Tax=Allacma fusca TaxID=39272 RepID=A0A8J2NX94_9HEXA|nr:unnamed protein product [Allacma fusca]
MLKPALIVFFISLGLCEIHGGDWQKKYNCDPKVCSDICGSTGVDDFTSFTCNPFSCKCYCNNPPPPNCLPDRDGRCDLYCKETYCGAYFGILCGSYQNPICTCACNPYGPYLRNTTTETKDAPNSILRN